MKLYTLPVLISVFSATSVPASSIVYPQLNVSVTDVVDTKTGQNQSQYKVDGMEIELTQKDQVKARHWGLTNSDWAKYKYLMEFTPRGLWSPDIDPPIALGNASRNPAEQRRYARIMNQLEFDRREAELKFQQIGHQDIKQQWPGSFQTAEPQRKGDFSRHLPETKFVLNSLFVDWSDCDLDCQRFVNLYANVNPANTKLDIYIANAESISDTQIMNRFGIKEESLNAGDVNFAKNSSRVKEFQGTDELPFVIRRDDDGTERFYP